MKYRNNKTGAVIDVKSKIVGGNWQAMELATSADKEKIAPVQEKKKGEQKER